MTKRDSFAEGSPFGDVLDAFFLSDVLRRYDGEVTGPGADSKPPKSTRPAPSPTLWAVSSVWLAIGIPMVFDHAYTTLGRAFLAAAAATAVVAVVLSPTLRAVIRMRSERSAR